LLSRIPLKQRYETDFSLTPIFVPSVGLVVCLLNLLLFFVLDQIVPDRVVLALIILGIQYLAFNLFHFDGFVDTVDGMLALASRERRLEILRDVHVGAFGLFFGIFYVACKIHFLRRSLEVPGGAAAAILLAYPLSGRIAAAITATVLGPAKADGLSAAVGQFHWIKTAGGVVLGCLPFGILYALYPFSPSLLLVFLGAPAACLVSGLILRIAIGGTTGDGLGFSIELGELFHLGIFTLCFAPTT
jgi:adenosylcobinamide-GDP ribazoletransferase